MSTTLPNACVAANNFVEEHVFTNIDKLVLKKCNAETFKSYVYRGIMNQNEDITFIYIDRDGHIYFAASTGYEGCTVTNTSSMRDCNIKLLLDVVRLLSYDITGVQIFSKYDLSTRTTINSSLFGSMHTIDVENSLLINLVDKASSASGMTNDKLVNKICDIYNVAVLHTSRQSEEIASLAAQLETANAHIAELQQETAKLVHLKLEVAEVAATLRSVVNYHYVDVKSVNTDVDSNTNVNSDSNVDADVNTNANSDVISDVNSDELTLFD